MNKEIWGAGNADYLEELYSDWKQEGKEIPKDWKEPLGGLSSPGVSPASGSGYPESTGGGQKKQHAVDQLITAYRELGHLYAQVNPLGEYMPPNLRYAWITQHGIGDELNPANFGLEEEDMDRLFDVGFCCDNPQATLREIIAQLQSIYTGPLGSEFTHIRNRPMRRWMTQQLEESLNRRHWHPEERRDWQENLIRAQEFESFIHSRFIGQKRFSLEGSEALISALRYLFHESPGRGVKEIIMGMAHRGRLNVLTNAMGKPHSEMFAMFSGHYRPHSYGGSGDVKYHMGQSADIQSRGKNLHISLVSNPSHLEAVDPVVQGKARGTQRLKGDKNRKKVLPLLIHGDAAFSGQGVVAETLNMSQLRGYRTGGTIHIVVNNQIGFTTASADSRSSFFATDVAKIMPVPVLHANGDDLDAVMRAMELALRWRQKFGQDVVVDLIGYRKQGHNEADEPSFTHPIMYNLIKEHESVDILYGRRLNEEGVFPMAEQDVFRKKYIQELEESLTKARELTNYHGFQTLKGDWAEVKRGFSFDYPTTGISEEQLIDMGSKMLEIPPSFKIHAKLKRFIANRQKVLKSREGVDWSFAEALAFASILWEGRSVRLSGEDCGRGTFSQRHAVWWDVSSAIPRQHTPLQHLMEEQGRFSVYDSPLSEFSILGFEYGYSLVQPEILVLWEAQFGDFVNEAQVIIDQFISAGESKWARHSGLVMLLPHAYEGQGSEHSHAYLERFLFLCAEENIQVANLTTPAQYFHILRKQLHQPFRKPLILMTPKSLLRKPEARSPLSALSQERFQNVLEDPQPPSKAQRVILCSGHVFYDLMEARKESPHTAIIRLEQLYPFPEEDIKKALSRWPQVQTFVWAQEEPKNRGAWSFIEPRLRELTGKEWIYAGRPPAASPATGAHERHEQELKDLLALAFGRQTKEEKKA